MKNINIIFQNSFLIFTRLYRETLCYNVFNDIDKIFADIIIIKIFYIYLNYINLPKW